MVRRPSPVQGRRPTREDLAAVDTTATDGVDDVLPPVGTPVRLLIVGVNPGLWTAAVNAPFARPGNRFWPSLHRAGITGYELDVSAGLSDDDEAHLIERGIGITNLVGRPTVRADQLTRDELRAGAERVIERVNSEIAAQAVAVAGITAFRTAFRLPKAQLGLQEAPTIPGWPPEIPLWMVPQPSGLNAHENIDSLAAKWREVWGSITPAP